MNSLERIEKKQNNLISSDNFSGITFSNIPIKLELSRIECKCVNIQRIAGITLIYFN